MLLTKNQEPGPRHLHRRGEARARWKFLHRNAVRGGFENPQFKGGAQIRWPGRGIVWAPTGLALVLQIATPLANMAEGLANQTREL
jgi:hypothetical protein